MALIFNQGREVLREPEGSTCSLVMAGDCCPWGSGMEEIRAGGSDGIVEAVREFFSAADVRLMQWETPLSEHENPIIKSGPNLLCPPEAMQIMTSLKVDVALLANNHSGDHGGDVATETMRHIQAGGIRTVGVGATPDEAAAPLRLKVNGGDIALLNFAENEFGTVRAGVPGCAPLDPVKNIADIRRAAGTADRVLVVVHGGHERNPMPSPRMMKTYRGFVEAGASAVINCHTHCPEGIEIWQGAPIVYSPGNFFFPWPDLQAEHLTAFWWIGYLPKLYFDRKGVYALEVMPFRFDNRRIHALTTEDRTAFYDYLARLNRMLEDDDAVAGCFDAWTAHHGPMYLELLRDRLAKWPIPLDNPEAVRSMMPVRNLFTCETHHDMLSRFLRMVEEGRVGEAAAGWETLARLQAPDWAVKVDFRNAP